MCTKLPAFFCTKYWILGVRFLAKRLDMVRTYSALPVLLLPALPRAPVSSMSPEPQSETIDAHWWNHDEIMMKSFETTSDSLFRLVFLPLSSTPEPSDAESWGQNWQRYSQMLIFSQKVVLPLLFSTTNPHLKTLVVKVDYKCVFLLKKRMQQVTPCCTINCEHNKLARGSGASHFETQNVLSTCHENWASNTSTNSGLHKIWYWWRFIRHRIVRSIKQPATLQPLHFCSFSVCK